MQQAANATLIVLFSNGVGLSWASCRIRFTLGMRHEIYREDTRDLPLTFQKPWRPVTVVLLVHRLLPSSKRCSRQSSPSRSDPLVPFQFSRIFRRICDWFVGGFYKLSSTYNTKIPMRLTMQSQIGGSMTTLRSGTCQPGGTGTRRILVHVRVLRISTARVLDDCCTTTVLVRVRPYGTAITPI